MARPPALAPDRPFSWLDGERTVVFGAGALDRAGELLGDGYLLLTTERAAQLAPRLTERAAAIAHVPAGRVDEVAGSLLGELGAATPLVALGGGRVIDTAKALAAATGRRVAAVPTTLSGAEMTGQHRRAVGAEPGTGFARPAVVLNEPALSASQPQPGLVASALNALGHAVEAPLAVRANPVSTLAALHGAELLVRALPPGGEPDRRALALGALLAGYAIDTAGYGLHHVLSQTLARFAGVGHGPANAAMLPHSLGALRERSREGVEALERALGGPGEEVAAALAARAGAARLRDLGVTRVQLGRCVEEVEGDPRLAQIPPAPDRAEIARLYEAAW